MINDKKVWQVLIGAICLIFIGLRFWDLTASCLWFDEIFSVHAATLGWNDLIWFVAQDLIHPPFFYLLLKIWIAVGGESLFWLRLFPVLFSVAALVPFYFLCRTLKLDRTTIVVAFAFFAANGALIKYSQEVRMYSLFLCLSLFSLWLFTRFFILGKNIWILTLINILLVNTHYFGWLLVFAQVVAILVLQNIKIRQILTMLGLNLVGFLPWMFALWRASQINADFGQNIGWIQRPNWRSLFDFIVDVVEPFYYQASNIDPSSIFIVSLPLLSLIAAAKIVYLSKWKDEAEKNNFFMLSILTGFPVAAAFLLSWVLPYSIWGSRHLIIVFAGMIILTAKFINGIHLPSIKYFFISFLALLFVFAFALESRRERPANIWCAWEALARDIDAGQAQKLYVFEDLVAYHFWFALRERSVPVQVAEVKNIEGIAEDRAYFLPRGFAGVKTENDFAGDHFWIAFRDARWNEAKNPLKILSEKGYQIGRPKTIEGHGAKAFLVEVKR